uniref:Uncharacterized protein n=2 Tax=Anopheles atroparvus TaxID=41427 RepID=A0AAG5D1M9_ANOAO
MKTTSLGRLGPIGEKSYDAHRGNLMWQRSISSWPQCAQKHFSLPYKKRRRTNQCLLVIEIDENHLTGQVRSHWRKKL